MLKRWKRVRHRGYGSGRANGGVNEQGQGGWMCRSAVPPGGALLETRSAPWKARLRSTFGNREARMAE